MNNRTIENKAKFNLILSVTLYYDTDYKTKSKKFNFRHNPNCLIPALEDLSITGDNRLKENRCVDKQSSIYVLLIKWIKQQQQQLCRN